MMNAPVQTDPAQSAACTARFNQSCNSGSSIAADTPSLPPPGTNTICSDGQLSKVLCGITNTPSVVVMGSSVAATHTTSKPIV